MDLSDLEVLKISKQITDIKELGIYLGLGACEVQAYTDANAQNPSRREGTYDMMKDWQNRPDSTKASLVQALRESNQGVLAAKVERGILVEGGQPVAAGASSTPAVSQPVAADDSPILNSVLRKIGGEITMNLDELADELGVSYGNLTNYKKSNYAGGGVTSDGTVKMLIEWKERTGAKDQRRKLREALQNAQLIRIQEEYLP